MHPYWTCYLSKREVERLKGVSWIRPATGEETEKFISNLCNGDTIFFQRLSTISGREQVFDLITILDHAPTVVLNQCTTSRLAVLGISDHEARPSSRRLVAGTT